MPYRNSTGFYHFFVIMTVSMVLLAAIGLVAEGGQTVSKHDRANVVRAHFSAPPPAISSLDVPFLVPDYSFGVNGSIRALINGGSMENEAFGVAIQADGKIVTAGRSNFSNSTRFAVSRFNTDGSLDSAFCGAGSRNFSIAGGVGRDYAAAIAIVQTDGNIVVAGYGEDSTGNNGIVIARLDPTGALDTTFGAGGSVLLHVYNGCDAYALAIQSDGKIVTAGDSYDSDYNAAFTVVRVNPDGKLDSTFGAAGAAKTFITGGDGTDDEASAIVIQPDGKIVVAGYSSNASSGRALVVARFNADGTIDNTFGASGSIRCSVPGGTGENDWVAALDLQPDGKIVLTGDSYYNSWYSNFFVGRLEAGGVPDNAFGTNGFVRGFFAAGDMNDYSRAIAVQPDGAIVIAGTSTDSNSATAFGVARVLPNGVIDQSIRSHISGGDGNRDQAYAMKLQADGAIVVAGSSRIYAFNNTFAVARYVLQPFGVLTLAPQVSNTTATLKGSANANNISTNVWFVYGISPKHYTDSLSAVPGSLSDNAGTPVSATLNGLSRGTTYYYCLAGKNSSGYVRGNEVPFLVGHVGSGNALAFDGIIQYAYHTPEATTIRDNLTMEAWVYWNGSTGDNENIMYNGTSSGSGYGIYLNASGDKLSILCGNVAYRRSDATLPLHTWVHVAAVCQSGTWTLFLNGIAQPLIGGNTFTARVPNGSLRVGGNFNMDFFKGVIDEVRISDTVRYDANFTPSLEPFVADNHAIALYHFDEGTASTACDASGHGQDLTLANSPTWTASDAPLPITLASFTGTTAASAVRLEWTTISETNNYGFYIQRRTPGQTAFTTISGLIPGAGTSQEQHQYTWTDEQAGSGKCFYRLKQVDLTGSESFSSSITISLALGVKENKPLTYGMSQNYPNPFNPTTDIGYRIADAGFVRLTIYDVLGQEVAALVNEVKTPGEYHVRWNASALSSGIYICKMDAAPNARTVAPFSKVMKIVLAK